MNDEMFRLSLIDVMNANLLNGLVNTIFGYDFNENEYVYIQYKLINGNVVLNIFDNKDSNRFKAYIFCHNDIANDDNDAFYINVDEAYKRFLENNGKNDNVSLIGALLVSKDNNEKGEIIDSLFDATTRDIFYKHFIL